jgi:murein L,D-transpeptidase YcbB/YkuD
VFATRGFKLVHLPQLRLILAGLLLFLPMAGFVQNAVPSPPPVVASPSNPLTEAIREQVDNLRYERLHDVRGSPIVLPDGVARYYESEQFQPHWQDAGRLDQLVAAIADLEDDGLNPSDYHIEALQTFRSDLRGGQVLPPAEQADLEMIATDAMMLGLSHLYFGKVNPEKLSPEWNFSARPLDRAQAFERFRQAVADGRIREAFDQARPQNAWYQRARARLRDYRHLQAEGGWSPISSGPTLKSGMSDPRVPALRYRLRLTKDLAGDLAPPLPPYDTTFDAELEAAVRHFQARQGLTADGAVGPGTLTALNVPVAARIDQIRVNLERARWVMHELLGDFVLVDVAGFDVAYFRNDEPIWTSKVIVGRPYRETPIFKSLITYVVFNPTWTIPPGILLKDKLPILRRDPGYLTRNHIRVIDSSGREVDPRSVDWSRYSGGRLPPYQLRQDPGEENALGLVKIMFPNKYSVYLHDTPTKSLFDRDERTFSSGCIRVQKAFELAELVLNDPEHWNQEAMAAVVASKVTKTVTLQKPVPVLLLYWTAQPTPDGQMSFRSDVYQRDPPTLAALDAPLAPRRR